MTPEEYKKLSVKEFTQAAKIYDSGHAGIYEMCKDDYPPILAELEKESFHDVLDCGCGTGPMIELLHEKYPEIDSVTPQTLPLITCNAFVMKKFCTELLWLNILSAAISRAMKTAVLMIVPVMVRCLGICLPLQERAVAYMLQCDACSSCHGVKRIFCHVERNVHLLRETGVQTSEQCAAS